MPENCCGGEFTDAACSDGLDNDQNGFADCADFGCKLGMFVTVCDGSSSTVDPALDGPEDTATACSDGYDNDGDGYTDCGDFGCLDAEDPAVSAHCEV